MANRYWVGGTGSWSSTARWSTSSGGSSGASVPTSTDNAYFDANSNTGTGSFTVTLDTTTRSCADFDASAVDGVMTLAGSQQLQIYGSMILPATNFTWSQSATLTFAGTGNINQNGITIGSSSVVFSGSGTKTLTAAFTYSGSVTWTAGDLNLNGYTFTAATFAPTSTSPRTLTFGSGGSFVLTGTGTVWNNAVSTNMTMADPANASITLTNTTTTARTFAGGGLSYGTLTIGGSTGTSTLTITGSNTFAAIASTKTVAHTISVTDGTTQTVGAWTVTGTSGNVVTLQGTSTAGWNLAYTGTYAPELLDYLSISRCAATPADTWYAGERSTDGGNNSGWQFMQDPDNFLQFF